MDTDDGSDLHAPSHEAGAPRRLVPDNLATGVDRPDLYDPKINRAYAELAAHYGCQRHLLRPQVSEDAASDVVEEEVLDVAGSGRGACVASEEHPAARRPQGVEGPDGRRVQRVWTVRLRRGQRVVVIAHDLGWPSAHALAGQLKDLLRPSSAQRGEPIE